MHAADAQKCLDELGLTRFSGTCESTVERRQVAGQGFRVGGVPLLLARLPFDLPDAVLVACHVHISSVRNEETARYGPYFAITWAGSRRTEAPQWVVVRNPERMGLSQPTARFVSFRDSDSPDRR